jgi:hypothetical protein
MITPKADPTIMDKDRMIVKIVPLADNLEALQQQLKVLRQRQKLLKGTGPLVAR